MKLTGLHITLIVAGLIAVTLIGAYVTAFGYGNRTENRLEATYDNMKNILSQAGLKVQDAAGVADKYKEGLQDVVNGAITGRYGEGGSKAVFQFIQERNPVPDVAVYTKIQQLIESGRNEFQHEQTIFIDTRRDYKTALGSLWTGFWLGVAGFPRKNPDDYKLIESVHGQDTFNSGVDKGFNIK